MTTTHSSSGDHHHHLPPTPPPPSSTPPTMEDLDFHHRHHASKEPTPSSISTSPTSSHEDLSPIEPPSHTLSTMSGTTSCTSSTSNHYRTPPQNNRKTIPSTALAGTKTTNINNAHVDLIELASTTLASAIIASKIIQKHSTLLSSSSSNNNKQNNHKSRTKNDGSIVTDADGESQRIITSYIRSISTEIRIVGEESNDEIQISQKGYHHKTWFGVSPGSKRKLMCKEKEDEEYIVKLCHLEVGRRYRYDQNKKNNQNNRGSSSQRSSSNSSQSKNDNDDVLRDVDKHRVNANRISIYVDPLDGTGAYAKGQYEAVTILAGIMLDNVPIFGIIVKPFGHEGCNVNFDIGAYSNMTPSTFTDTDTNLSSSSGSYPQQQQTDLNQNHNRLGFLFPCSVLYGGTLLGGGFIFSGDELRRSRIHRTKQVSMTIPSCTSLESKESTLSSSSSSSLLLMANRSLLIGASSQGIEVQQTTTTTTSATIKHDTQNNNTNQQRKAIISKSRRGGVVKQCINSLSSKGLLHPEPIFITGAGYKTMRLLLGTYNETMWFFPKPGTSLWDVAAADALLRVMGGRLSDKFGDDLDYSKSWTDADNLDGIVACTDADLHAKCIELYHDECWDDEDC